VANYDSIEEMMDTTENMEHLVDNVGHDDDTMTFSGVDWFLFNGVKASNLYVSGNSWIGVGSNAEQLQICRRDAKMWHFYREEATLFHVYRVLKIRWEGYAQYNSTSSDVHLIYEWFFLETGDIMLNLILPPANSGYLGTNRINGSVNQNISVTAGQPMVLSLYSQDEEGVSFVLKYETLDIHAPYEQRYLLADKDGKYYRTEHEKAFVDAITFKGFQLIRTGIVPNQSTKVAVRFRTDTFSELCLFGARKDTESQKFGVFLTNSTSINGQFGTASTVAEADDYSGIDVELELSAEGLKRDGVVIAEYVEDDFECPCELTIGAMNTDGSLDSRMYKGDILLVSVFQDGEEVLHLVPCVDEDIKPCFYDTITETCFYNAGHGAFGFVDTEGKYDEATKLVEIEISELTAETILAEGFEDFPRSEVLARLVNPSLLYWHDSDDDIPNLTVELKAVPPVQTVYSKNTLMNDSTILGIEKVEIEADDTTLFAFSFDGGTTWKAYIDNSWVSLSETTSGMNRETVEAIGTDAWTIANEHMQYMVRFTLIEGGYVNRIIIHYLN
jgi:hypothetical protein